MSCSEEEWKPVVGYDHYWVSNKGQVKSTQSWRDGKAYRILAASLTHYGYPCVSLCRKGQKKKDKLVHRLVAETFIGPCPAGKEVNHKDGIKTNAHVENLEYVTDSEQRQHAYDTGLQKKGADRYNSKLNADKVRQIRELRGTMKGRDIAKLFNVAPSHVCNIQKGYCWKD